MKIKCSENFRFSPLKSYEQGVHVKTCTLYNPGVGGGVISGRAGQVIMSFWDGNSGEYVDISMSLTELDVLRKQMNDMLSSYPPSYNETTTITTHGAE